MIAGCEPLYLPHQTNLIDNIKPIFFSISKSTHSLEICVHIPISMGDQIKFQEEVNVIGRKRI